MTKTLELQQQKQSLDYDETPKQNVNLIFRCQKNPTFITNVF